MGKLEKLFNPSGIAIVGAQENLSRGGGQPLRALMAYGYQGKIYPINPKKEYIAGLRCYASLNDIDGPCEVAIIAIAEKGIFAALEACASKSIPFAVIYSAAFRGSGEEGLALEKKVLLFAKQSGIRLIGPNCLGVVNVKENVYAAFGSMSREPRLKPGFVSLVSQSGGFGYSLVLRCAAQGIGFRHLISSGNEIDLKTPELIDAQLDDPHTHIVLVYIEGVSEGRSLLEVAHKAARMGKPILLWKAGNSVEGRRAAASHTGNMTGSYDVYKGAMMQSGIIAVQSFEEVVEFIKAFSGVHRPTGPRVAVMSASGGAGAVFADSTDVVGIKMSTPSPNTIKTLRALGFEGSEVMNPVDCPPGFLSETLVERFAQAVDALLNDPNVDQLHVLLMTLIEEQALHGALVLAQAYLKTQKPIFVFSAVERHLASKAFEVLEKARIPLIGSPPLMPRVSSMLLWHTDLVRRIQSQPDSLIKNTPLISEATRSVLRQLSEVESKAFIDAQRIPILNEKFVKIGESVGTLNQYNQYAVKIVSPDIAHKSDVGGVKLNIAAPEVESVSIEMLKQIKLRCPNAELDGILVSPMIYDAVEVIVAVINDPVFGPVVSVGLGGVFTELLKDLTFRVGPFDKHCAHDMIRQLRGAALFMNFRGRAEVDVDALADTLVRLSEVGWEFKDQIQEIEINPMLVLKKGEGVVAADALVVFKQ
jgi:acetyltransferase